MVFFLSPLGSLAGLLPIAGGQTESQRVNPKAALQRLEYTMITRLKHLLIVLGIGSVLTLGSTGCNTAHGFGKDLEKAGDKIQEGTK